MSDVVMPAVQACGTSIIYRPVGCVTVGTASQSEGHYIIVPLVG